MKTLENMGYIKGDTYLYDTAYWGVKDKSLLRWDFIVFKGNKKLVIEYDGKFHYKPVRFGNMTDEEVATAFKNTQRRDKIKDDHCGDNGFPLLRIPYWDFKNTDTLVRAFMKN